jgi:hypothetical protein
LWVHHPTPCAAVVVPQLCWKACCGLPHAGSVRVARSGGVERCCAAVVAICAASAAGGFSGVLLVSVVEPHVVLYVFQVRVEGMGRCW